MIFAIGAHGDMLRARAISAISHAVTPTRLCAFSISSAKRALGAPLADLSTLGDMFVGAGESARVRGSAACGLVPPLRPARVEARRVFAALIWQGRLQKIWSLPLRGG
jgi:hypothetical protein